MRNTLINAIHSAALKNKNIVFLTGDLGYSVIERFKIELPNQFINTGIAEQNMIGVAAGLALAGKKVFVYSIAPFATMRCFEQIRLDVCYQNLDVNIIGVGGGFAYGTLGTTHFGIEDLSIMRTLPNMKVVAFYNRFEAVHLFNEIVNTKGPYYIRLNRGAEQTIIEETVVPKIGKGSILKDGSHVTIFSIGSITDVALIAANNLESCGIGVEVVHIHTLKPIDKEIIKDRAQKRTAIFTLEEHVINGGLGSAVAEILAESGLTVRFRRLGIEDVYLPVIGKQDYLRFYAGLSPKAVEEIIKNYVD